MRQKDEQLFTVVRTLAVEKSCVACSACLPGDGEGEGGSGDSDAVPVTDPGS
jgi:hypothetical protein